MNRYVYYFDYECRNFYKKMTGFLDRHVTFKNKDILCLGSGSGYFPLHYVEKGARTVTCLDISSDFIKLFSGKLGALGADSRKVSILKKDMAGFELKKKFDLVLINGNAFACLLSQEEQLACLESIRRHLKPGGKAYVNIVPFSDKLNEKFSLKRSFTDAKGLSVAESVYAAMFIPDHRLDFHITWSSKEGVFRDVVKSRILTLPEMHLLFKVAGLKIRKVFFDYSERVSNGAYSRTFEVGK